VLKLTVFKSTAGMAFLTKPPILLQVVNLFISFLERSFVMPIYAIALLLFYNDQRTRQEGYDIELLMVQAGWPEMPSAVLPGTSEVSSHEAPPETMPGAPESGPGDVSAPDPPEVTGG
jgi:hypothetical protein